MVHVSMAMAVMAYLAFTWSTVVLLGGYVTSLEKKDFWCLTLISLLEATWIFNDMESDTKLMMSLLLFVKDSIPTAIDITKSCLPPSANSGNTGALYLFMKMATVLYTGILMAPVMVVIFSILIVVVLSPGLFVALPVWRLHQHDYGVIGGDSSKASLVPALDIFYSLVLVQGVLSIFMSATGPTQALGLIHFYKQCNFPKKWGMYAILGYIEDTMEKCKQDLVSVQEASLLSHASELLGSESWDKYLTGVRVMGTFSQLGMEDSRATILLSRQKIQKLILTLGLTQSSINEWLKQRSKDKVQKMRLPELREHAARIVAGFADGIQLAQFPGAARCISTLLETTDEDDSIELIVQGLNILEKLVLDHNNCQEICSIPGLLPKIMAPISSAGLIQDQDTRIARSSTVIKGTFKVLRGLTCVPGKTGRRLRREISCNKKAVTNLESIIILDHGNNNKDDHELQMLAMEILLELAKDKSINLNGETIQNVIKKQVDIFLADNAIEEAAAAAMYKDVAGKALLVLSSNSESNSAIIMQARRDTVGCLIDILDAKNSISHKIFAVEILRNLCEHCANV
ncbi:hypothetical protein QOZ80_9BG0693540 [Eleusine coracana subsp. coracana]|nr:hypothetical protein QOZ80_9BG0693540 [Eleusine coracana subsp. coracana]